MSYETALWAGAAATILYTFVGGFLAVSWTDTVQASLMIFALILTPVIVIISVGGFGDSLEVIKQKSIENVAERAELRGHYFADGLGPGLLWSAAYSGALYGGGFSPQHRSCPSYQYDLDDPLPGGCGGGRLLRYRLLQ
jgi:Na+/proline symporter